MHRRTLSLSLVLAACGGGGSPPPAAPAQTGGTAPAEAAPPALVEPGPGAGPAGPAPYDYAPELRQPFMEGCMGECATEIMCSCMYEKLQWIMPSDDALAGKLTDAQVFEIRDTCVAEHPDPGPLPPGCE